MASDSLKENAEQPLAAAQEAEQNGADTSQQATEAPTQPVVDQQERKEGEHEAGIDTDSVPAASSMPESHQTRSTERNHPSPRREAEPGTTESHRTSSPKGPRGLKGVHELKSSRGLKGVHNLRGAPGVEGDHGPKSASALPGVHQIKGMHKNNPKVDIAISILQALLQHAMKSQIEKLQGNVHKAATGMKENLQSGLQRGLQAGADTIGGTRQDKEKEMASDSLKENAEQPLAAAQEAEQNGADTSQQATEAQTQPVVDQQEGKEGKHEAGIDKENAEQPLAAAQEAEQNGADTSQQATEAQTQPVEDQQKGKEGEHEAGIDIDSAKDLMKKFATGFGTARETLNMVATGVDVAQDVLKRAGPSVAEGQDLRLLRNTLNNVSKGVSTAQDILNKVGPFVEHPATASRILDIVSTIVVGARAIHDIMDTIAASIRSIQDALGKVAASINVLSKVAPLVSKLEGAHPIQDVLNKLTPIIDALRDFLNKIISGISAAQHALLSAIDALRNFLNKIISGISAAPHALLGQGVPLIGRHPEGSKEAEQQKEQAADTLQEKGVLPPSALEFLRQSNIINMDMPLETLFNQIKDFQPDSDTGWGLISDTSHGIMVWSGK